MPLLPFSSQAENSQAKLAVLIDADNTQPAIIEGLLDEVAKYGVASIKRIYGDWTSVHLRSWKERLLANAIQPIQQFSYTTGKNSTDSAMIIDAMDLLYSEKLDGFCIVSSDSDFTRLPQGYGKADVPFTALAPKKPQRLLSKSAINSSLPKFCWTIRKSPKKKAAATQNPEKNSRLTKNC